MFDFKLIESRTGINFDTDKNIGGQVYGYYSMCGDWMLGVTGKEENSRVIIGFKGWSRSFLFYNASNQATNEMVCDYILQILG